MAQTLVNADAPLALTMGDPGGVGGELAIAAWRALSASGPGFFVIDDPERLTTLGAEVAVISSPAAARSVFSRAIPVIDIGARIKASPGASEPRFAPHVIASIERAVAYALSGEAAGVVTAPIQKSTLRAAGFEFPGHTEFIGALTADAPMPQNRSRGPVMMLASPRLRTVPVTVHLPLARAVAALTIEMIVQTGRVVAESLRSDFGIASPRIAIAGLNPHAGEAGALGDEEARIVAPAAERLCAAGIDIRGPLPADTMFHAEARARYDAALCMYHDQALIPVKALAFHEAVNVTLGLPVIRTSPDHGTALDIAGKGVARPDSLIAALKLAAEMAARRAGAGR